MPWSPAARASMSRDEGRTMRGSRSRVDTDCSTRSRGGSRRKTHKRQKTGKSTLERFRNGCQGGFKQASNAINSWTAPDYGSLPGKQVDTGVSETLASTIPPSTLRPSAPGTSLGGPASTIPTTKRRVHFPDGYDEEDGPFEGMTWEQKAAAYKHFITKDETMDANRKKALELEFDQESRYNQTMAIKGLRRLLEADAKASKAAETSAASANQELPTMDEWHLRHHATRLYYEVKELSAYNRKGGISEAQINSIVRGLLEDGCLKDVLKGSPDGVTFQDGWGKTAIPPEHCLTVALDPEDRETQKKYLLSQLRPKNKDGTELSPAEADALFDNKYDHPWVTLRSEHPLWSKYSNYQRRAEPRDFAELDPSQVQMLRDQEERILAAGGTLADVDKAWKDKYDPDVEVVEGQDSVLFRHLKDGTYTGRMTNGTEVTMTCGPKPAPQPKFVIDTSTLGLNPWVADKAGVDLANAKQFLADQATLEKNKKAVSDQRTAALEEKGRAEARWRAGLRPLPSTNGATCLSDIPSPPTIASTESPDPKTTGPASHQSWNGYTRGPWENNVGAGRGPGVERNPRRWRLAAEMATMMERGIQEKFPELKEGLAFTIATAMADSLFLGKEKQGEFRSQIPGFLKKHGIETDVAGVDEAFALAEASTTYNGQRSDKWASTPSWLPGTAEKLNDVQARDRLAKKALFSSLSMFPSKTPEQYHAIGSWLTDLYTGPEMTALRTNPEEFNKKIDEKMDALAEKLKAFPDFTPDGSTKL